MEPARALCSEFKRPIKRNVRSLQSLGNFLYLYFLTCGIISYIVSGLWRLDTSPLLWSSICTSLFSCDYCHRDHLRLRLWEEAKKVDTVQLAFMALFPRSAFPVFALLPPLCPSVRPSARSVRVRPSLLPDVAETRNERGPSDGASGALCDRIKARRHRGEAPFSESRWPREDQRKKTTDSSQVGH